MKKNVSILAEELLSQLRKKGEFLSAEKLTQDLKINFKELKQAKKELEKWGYKIESDGKKGYKLAKIPDLLLPLEIKYDLKSKILGQEIHSYQALKSTNDLAFNLAEGEAPEGTLVVAEKQTRGKGRLGRNWFSPPKLGVWMSLILRPPILPSQAPGLSIAASLALVLTTKELTGLPAFIKWPNDVIVNNQKFCGILTELSAELDKINFVILGVGINVNHTERDFPKNLRSIATSLRIEKGEQVSRVDFLKRFLEKFEKIYLQYKKTGLLTFKEECLRHSYLLGKKIKIQVGSEILEGKAENLDDNGALILRTKEGLRTITAGDVSLL